MKKILILLLFATVLFSCKKDTIMNYEGKSGIYFVLPFDPFYPADTMVVSFALGDATVKDSTINIPVRALGSVSSQARDFKVIVEDSSTAKAGVHYTMPSIMSIKPNAVTDVISLTLHRTPDMQSRSYMLYLTLVENENFSVPVKSKITNPTTGTVLHYTRMKVIVSDMLTKPMYWLDYYLGDFSRKKVYLMADVLDVPIKEVAEISDIGKQNFWGRYMQIYLNDKKGSGNPVYEEDGSEMIMGMGVQ
ncbi:MAG: DUF4843 domain-containing protein [Niabella sp.]